MKGKKGFTLVEVIVVLIILAILAAILIPSMVHWIDEAEKERCYNVMGMVARDYHVCVAETGYGQVKKINIAQLSASAIKDVTDQTGSGSYTCPGGGTCTLSYGQDGLSISSIVCSKHGAMTFGETMTVEGVTAVGGQLAAALKTVSLGNKALYSNVADSRLTAFQNTLKAAQFSGLNALLSGKTWVVNPASKTTLYIYNGDLSTKKEGEKIQIIVYDVATGKAAAKNAYVGTAPAGGSTVHTINFSVVY